MQSSRKLRWAVLVVVAPVVTECDHGDYPIEPTFCDDWCHMLLRSGCDQEPENCVRTCEQTIAPRGCHAFELELLACYEATSPHEFACSGLGFQEIARPEERVCRSERDSLIDCAYPDVKRCLDVCRVVEASYAADSGNDAGLPPGRICPSYDIPCDSICWAARSRLRDPADPGRGARDAGDLDGASEGGSGLGEFADQLIACAIGRARACRSDNPEDAGDASDDGGARNANWSSVLRDCAEELGL